ncbi:uncharacterized protein LOC143212444 [Lasioglossum baleicum]|uniref:uncharacterized protein LOC143212444 n=1 Tax=Lasioglossum baleicum TaxID=434251 RepID=UPI003FCCBD78
MATLSLDIKTPFTDFVSDFKTQSRKSTNNFIKEQGLFKGKECRSNHYNLNASLARVKIIVDSACECGAESQDLDHVIWQCPKYEDERDTLLSALLRCKYCFPTCIKCFLYGPDIKGLSIIFDFIKRCAIKI